MPAGIRNPLCNAGSGLTEAAAEPLDEPTVRSCCACCACCAAAGTDKGEDGTVILLMTCWWFAAPRCAVRGVALAALAVTGSGGVDTTQWPSRGLSADFEATHFSSSSG